MAETDAGNPEGLPVSSEHDTGMQPEQHTEQSGQEEREYPSRSTGGPAVATGQQPDTDSELQQATQDLQAQLPGKEIEKQPFWDDDHNRADQILELRASVFRLLRHAVSEATVKPEEVSKALETAVPALCMMPGALSPQDEMTLWKTCNLLTALVHPTTSDGLKVYEEIEQNRKQRAEGQAIGKGSSLACRFRLQLYSVVILLALMVFTFLIAQAYVIVLSDTLRNFEDYHKTLATVERQINDLIAANPGIAERATPLEKKLPYSRLMDEKEGVLHRIKASTHMLQTLMIWPWRDLYKEPEFNEPSKDVAAQTAEDKKEQKKMANGDGPGDSGTQLPPEAGAMGDQSEEPEAVDESLSVEDMLASHTENINVEPVARTALQVTTYYLLPLILGVLGAVAYIVRRMIESMANKSYTLNKFRTYGMRLALGALLGVMSGILVAPDQSHAQSFSLSLVLLAFLMGYSVEFAFSIFDSLIARGRQALQSDAPSPYKAPLSTAGGRGENESA
jgi:hypothetical protein